MWDAVFSPDGKRLAACGTKGIRIWDVASRETPATWPSDSDFGYCLAFSPDGKRLAMGGLEGMVELWDTATGQKVQSFKGHFGPVNALAFSPGRHAPGHGGRGRHPAPLGHDRTAGRRFDPPGRAVDAWSSPRSAPTARLS